MQRIEAIEKRLWASADNLRANSNYASNEYFLPIMGLIFLRHAYSRYLRVKSEIEAHLPTRGGKPRPLTREDFSEKGAIYLRPEAQFDYLVSLPDSDDRSRAIVHAMESIEEDYETLKGVLPKAEYQELDNDVLGQLLRTFNDPALKSATGDVFGRIYEYFLTRFADLKAHDNGEFFTPVSLVRMIAGVIEPDHGKVLDPACGSGGMFVQSAHFIERLHQNPTERATFYGMEKNPTTIRLAKMNLAVHGLEGNIQKAITYYEDPHEMLGKADFVMANPPFNVDEVDADKVKNDPRLPFGLPGVNKKGKVSNGNYLWISYFHSYLNERGRAGFVMSSQASSAGRDEAKVRRKLIETGDVDVMIAIRSNFFYTRTVPCELWFLDRNKPVAMRDKVLMIDARNIYRKVTRKIYDFSPEQMANLTSIVWLYRGETDRYLELISEYLGQSIDEAQACMEREEDDEITHPLPDYLAALHKLEQILKLELAKLPKDSPVQEQREEWTREYKLLAKDVATFHQQADKALEQWNNPPDTNAALVKLTQKLELLSEASRDLIKQTDLLYKLAIRLIEGFTTANGKGAGDKRKLNRGEIRKQIKALDEVRKNAVEQLRQVRYFWRQAHWLIERFPSAELRDVEGLVKLVNVEEIEANDWSLTPGRYVGVAPEEEDEDFDFEETLREIHVELEDLNAEAVQMAATIKRNFEELGV